VCNYMETHSSRKGFLQRNVRPVSLAVRAAGWRRTFGAALGALRQPAASDLGASPPLNSEARSSRPDLRDCGRVVGGGVGRDQGKPLAGGGHDVVDAPGADSLLGGFVEVPSPSPPNPLPRVKTLVPAWAVAASRCRSPS
jgi:hypothetical protein